PELYRYSGLTIYGESLTVFDTSQINKELELYRMAKKTDLIMVPGPQIFALCHNILIHTPETGREFLKLLNRPSTDKQRINYLFSAAIFSQEFGESLALTNLESNDAEWSRVWADYLSVYATYDSSIPRIEKMLKETSDTDLQIDLLLALMYISNPESEGVVRKVIERTNSDEVQKKAIFVYTELTGYEGIRYLETVKTVGLKSDEEKKSSLAWLKKETSAKQPYGTEVQSDIDFINRFRTINSPAMNWMRRRGLLTAKRVNKPKPLHPDEKNQLMDLLIQSKGFGLEAVKGCFFLSLEKGDLPKLFQLRAINYYSPNEFTKGRMNTAGILIRYMKKEKRG
ncbi:MAG: hypothetical protein ACJ75J_14655, partial [Cytophagaceae bacterium]